MKWEEVKRETKRVPEFFLSQFKHCLLVPIVSGSKFYSLLRMKCLSPLWDVSLSSLRERMREKLTEFQIWEHASSERKSREEQMSRTAKIPLIRVIIINTIHSVSFFPAYVEYSTGEKSRKEGKTCSMCFHRDWRAILLLDSPLLQMNYTQIRE